MKGPTVMSDLSQWSKGSTTDKSRVHQAISILLSFEAHGPLIFFMAAVISMPNAQRVVTY